MGKENEPKKTFFSNMLGMASYDVRFKFPFAWLLAGGSGCGKTTKVLNFLRNHKVNLITWGKTLSIVGLKVFQRMTELLR